MRWQSVIAHGDMDAFYAAIEQLDDPSLRGKPVIVGHPGGRGVVTTASYEARPYRVGSAMPMALALRRCPHAAVVPPRFERYLEVSKLVMEVFRNYSPVVEALSLDEAFLDLSGSERLLGAPADIGRAIKRDVWNATGGLAVSVGIAATKFVAKVGSDLHKPDGLTVVPLADTEAFLAPLPVSRLWGAGPVVQGKLESLGLQTLGDVAVCDPRFLERQLGKAGPHFHRLARGLDSRAVIGGREAKSIGAERTLEEDISGDERVWRHLLSSLDTIAHRLRKGGIRAGGVRVKLKTADFRLHTRQATLRHATDSAAVLAKAARPLLQELPLDRPIRLVGAAAFALTGEGAGRQLGLFAEPGESSDPRHSRLNKALDGVWDRFGTGALRRGSELEKD